MRGPQLPNPQASVIYIQNRRVLQAPTDRALVMKNEARKVTHSLTNGGLCFENELGGFLRHIALAYSIGGPYEISGKRHTTVCFPVELGFEQERVKREQEHPLGVDVSLDPGVHGIPPRSP